MRHITTALTCILLTLALTGCSGYSFPRLGVSAYALNIPADQSEVTLDVWNDALAAPPLSFAITSDQPWLSVAPPSGESAGPDDRHTVLVRVDRSLAFPDLPTGNLTISTGVGRLVLRVTVLFEAVPEEEIPEEETPEEELPEEDA